jgi:cysteine dioxygenase
MTATQHAPGLGTLGDLTKFRPDLTEWSVDRLHRLAEEVRARIDGAALVALAPFDSIHYARRTLVMNESWEISLIGWLPGQETPAHDHLDSVGLTIVLAGSLEESRFALRGGAAFETSRRTLETGACAIEDLDTVHRMVNAGEDPAVSLHVYAPPLVTMRCYEIRG